MTVQLGTSPFYEQASRSLLP